MTVQRLRGGRLASPESAAPVQTVQEVVEADGRGGSGRGGTGMRSRWCRGCGKVLKSSSLKRARAVVVALCCHPRAKGLLLLLVGGRVPGFGPKLWQPMWEVPILLWLSIALRPLQRVLNCCRVWRVSSGN